MKEITAYLDIITRMVVFDIKLNKGVGINEMEIPNHCTKTNKHVEKIHLDMYEQLLCIYFLIKILNFFEKFNTILYLKSIVQIILKSEINAKIKNCKKKRIHKDPFFSK